MSSWFSILRFYKQTGLNSNPLSMAMPNQWRISPVKGEACGDDSIDGRFWIAPRSALYRDWIRNATTAGGGNDRRIDFRHHPHADHLASDIPDLAPQQKQIETIVTGRSGSVSMNYSNRQRLRNELRINQSVLFPKTRIIFIN